MGIHVLPTTCARALILGLVAGITCFIVNTNYSATGRAFPFFLFVFQEFLDTICLNVLQILNHAHSIFVSVAFIKCF